MAEATFPTDTVWVEYHCDEEDCAGVVTATGQYDTNDDDCPLLHECTKCQRPYRFGIKYPTVRHTKRLTE